MTDSDSVFRTEPALQARPVRLPLERLALLYEGIFTVIVRVQSGKQQISDMDAFRERMKSALNEVGQLAAQRGYSPDTIAQANFAVIAFLDEAVLTSNEAGRTQWARKTLGEEILQQRSAGELFFQRLDQLRGQRDTPELIQVLEVYYLCLLLGFEGRFAVGSKGELYLMMDNVRERIERVAGRPVALSPDLELESSQPAPIPAAAPDPFAKRARLLAIAAAAFVFICFLIFRMFLFSETGNVHGLL